MTRSARALHRLAGNVRAAIDLASIMVGVLVIGLIAGVISATVFAVIPWAQDRAAAGSLDAVVTAEAVHRTKQGTYATSDGLVGAGLLQQSPNVAVTSVSSCYVAVAKSQSGKTFWVDDRSGSPTEVTPTSMSPCASVTATAAMVSTSTARVNLQPNPSSATTPLGGTGSGSYTRALAPEKPHNGTPSTKFVWQSGTAGTSSAVIDVTPNTTYTASVYVFVESGAYPAFKMSDTNYVTNAKPMAPITEAGSWRRVYLTYTTLPTQTTLRVWADVDVPSTWYADSFLIEKSATLNTYFDGDTPGAYWAGEPHKSASVLP